MPTLAELGTLHDRGTNDIEALIDRIRGAVLVAAGAIQAEATSVPLHAERLVWAKQAFIDPRRRADEMWGAILAAHSAAGITMAQILGANDTAIQAAVTNAVNVFLEAPVVA